MIGSPLESAQGHHATRAACAIGCVALLALRAAASDPSNDVRDSIQWVAIPAGSFMMGIPGKEWVDHGYGAVELGYRDEKPVHRVTVKAFEVAKTEVTFGQYRKCVGAGACTPPHVADNTCALTQSSVGALPQEFQGDEQPVVCVTRGQAEAFSRWVGGRLPSEAEWEYAARSAGGKGKYPWGEAPPDGTRVAANTALPAKCFKSKEAMQACGGDGCGRQATCPVCSKPKGNTKQGVCDMSGNVSEFVQDKYHRGYVGAPADGSPREDGSSANRVIRGSSWWTREGYSEHLSGSRSAGGPSVCTSNIGFRPVRSRQ